MEKLRNYTKEQGDELLKKLNFIKLSLIAHPDNQPDSEFADMIDIIRDVEIIFLDCYDIVEYAKKVLFDQNKKSFYKN